MTVSPERLAGSALRRLHYRATRRHQHTNNKVTVMSSSTTSANTSTDSNATALTSVTNDSLSPPRTPTHEQTRHSADDDDDAFLTVDTSRVTDARPPPSPKAARDKHESRFDFDIPPGRRGSEPRNRRNNAETCSPRRRSVHVTANPLAGAPPPPGRTTIVVQQPSLSLDYGGCATVLLPPRRSPPDALLDARRAEDGSCRVGHHARSQSVKAARRATELLSPPARARVASMPNTGGEEDYYRLRHFSITGKGVVNRGDSLRSRRSRSNTSVASSASSEHNPPTGGHSRHSSRDSSPDPRSYRVAVLGAPGVGKSSLIGQFMTSEYLHAYDTSIDDESGERSVCVLLAGEESEITFLDNPSLDVVRSEGVHGYCVVYSSADRASILNAGRELRALGAGAGAVGAAVILVANKADLARSREVSTEEGKALATQYECKFIETSVGINHNVDELLVGLLTQIRLKRATDKRARRGRPRSPPASPPAAVLRNAPLSANSTPRKRTRLSASVKVRGLLTRVWARDALSRSCENLHVL